MSGVLEKQEGGGKDGSDDEEARDEGLVAGVSIGHIDAGDGGGEETD